MQASQMAGEDLAPRSGHLLYHPHLPFTSPPICPCHESYAPPPDLQRSCLPYRIFTTSGLIVLHAHQRARAESAASSEGEEGTFPPCYLPALRHTSTALRCLRGRRWTAGWRGWKGWKGLYVLLSSHSAAGPPATRVSLASSHLQSAPVLFSLTSPLHPVTSLPSWTDPLRRSAYRPIFLGFGFWVRLSFHPTMLLSEFCRTPPCASLAFSQGVPTFCPHVHWGLHLTPEVLPSGLVFSTLQAPDRSGSDPEPQHQQLVSPGRCARGHFRCRWFLFSLSPFVLRVSLPPIAHHFVSPYRASSPAEGTHARDLLCGWASMASRAEVAWFTTTAGQPHALLSDTCTLVSLMALPRAHAERRQPIRARFAYRLTYHTGVPLSVS
ncbi:unnamed protein product [Pleuronectes platessa]|uniref:Uncharacterized protein n=1 Tax=Pleuronectes platessa TaxID=8262 RepID=A0A9N7ZAL7_PLEPL|nr:unnamed protein product [Pleuronectes platessa]